MANKYFSEIRTLIAKDFFNATINPVTNFVVNLGVSNDRWIWFDQGIMNKQTNMLLKRIMITSNFADGLVWAVPCDAFTVRLVPSSFLVGAVITGTTTFNGGTKNVTGVGTNFATYAPGDVIYDRQNFIYEFATITNDTTATVRECIPLDIQAAAPNGAGVLTAVGNDTDIQPFHINMLNTWYTADAFFNPALFSGSTATVLGVEVQVRTPDNVPGITFLTKSIDTDFAEDTCFFDLVAEVEYTPL